MSFKKVPTLDTDSTVTIGGKDKKTGKANPKSIEGYFLGTKAVGQNKFNKSKTDYIHILQTQDGNVGVWGKTHMDRQLLSVTPGVMIRVTFSGTKDVGKGNAMNCYLVEVDEENTIEVNFNADNNSVQDEYVGSTEYSDEEDENSCSDESPSVGAVPSRRAAQPPSEASINKTRALLGAGKN